jgi:hypothetical protein
MTLEISIGNTDAIVHTLDDMIKQINNISSETYTELEDWQTDDVRFRRPYMKRVDEFTVETLIWPRGKRRPKGRRTRARGHRRLRRATPQKIRKRRMRLQSRFISTSYRPLLRESLFDKLVNRMDMILEKVEWQ